MWGMIALIALLAGAAYFHFRKPPVLPEKDTHSDHGGTLDDHAENIAKRAMSDPNYTPYN